MPRSPTPLQHLSLCSQTPDKATEGRACIGSWIEGVRHRGGGRHSSKNTAMAAGHLASTVRNKEEAGGSCAVHFLHFTQPRTSAHSMMLLTFRVHRPTSAHSMMLPTFRVHLPTSAHGTMLPTFRVHHLPTSVGCNLIRKNPSQIMPGGLFPW